MPQADWSQAGCGKSSAVIFHEYGVAWCGIPVTTGPNNCNDAERIANWLLMGSGKLRPFHGAWAAVLKITVTGEQSAVSSQASRLIAGCHSEREMTRKLLALALLVVLGWTVANASVPEVISRSTAPRAATPAAMVASPVQVASNSLEVHRPPVPLVRTVRPLPVKAAASEVATPDAEAKAPDDKTRDDKAQDDAGEKAAAKAAIEADGYKRVSVLGRIGEGTWRAKAYRGQTVVGLTVDGTGRVSLD
jgi:hypothetical protein